LSEHLIDSRSGKDSGVPRSAAADRRTIDRLPRRSRLREGRSWRLWLSGDGARIARLAAPGATPATAAGEDAAAASARGTASELVLLFYGRTAVDSLTLDGDRRIFDQLIAWDPDA
jgi:hypothetical protein